LEKILKSGVGIYD